MRASLPRSVIWHELECHGYHADLPVWRQLAIEAGGPVLDVGAGTGRVALDLADRGHEVTALDLDPELLAAIDDPRVDTVAADAQDFDLGRDFALMVVPMQTVQLLGDRGRFLRAARGHLRPGGMVAMAIAGELEPFGGDLLPLPDVAERGGWRFSSQPVALTRIDGAHRIDRVRTAWGPDGERDVEPNAIDLADLDPGTLEREATAAGLTPLARREIPATDDHVGSTVVVCGA